MNIIIFSVSNLYGVNFTVENSQITGIERRKNIGNEWKLEKLEEESFFATLVINVDFTHILVSIFCS